MSAFELPPYAEVFAPQLRKALSLVQDPLTYEDLIGRCAAGIYQWWYTDQCVIVTEVITFPRLRVLRVVVAAGDLKAIRELAPKIEDWARLIGCGRVEIYGRGGWTRALRDFGYEQTAVVLSKPLAAVTSDERRREPRGRQHDDNPDRGTVGGSAAVH